MVLLFELDKFFLELGILKNVAMGLCKRLLEQQPENTDDAMVTQETLIQFRWVHKSVFTAQDTLYDDVYPLPNDGDYVSFTRNIS